MSLRVLLLSAYDAASHQRWREELAAQFPAWQWTQLALPPRYFNWRIRGNSLTWAVNEKPLLTADYDLLIATSMVDLSALRGFVPALASLPTLVYFHENQFAYPASDAQFESVEPKILNLYTALCADVIRFNSAFNRDSFLTGVADLLRRLPDHVPPGVEEQLRERSAVLPVPLEKEFFEQQPRDGSRLTLIWNHRWEYDKGPERLLAALQRFFAAPDAPAITVHVVGQQFRTRPPAFDELHTLLAEQGALGAWGYMDSAAEYRALLQQSHVVLSTALHDFQGLAVLESVAAGCLPVVPARQAYPEWFGEDACYHSDIEQPEREAEALARRLRELAEAFTGNRLPSVPDIGALSWSTQAPRYEELLFSLAEAR